jgi:hypothetical protein
MEIRERGPLSAAALDLLHTGVAPALGTPSVADPLGDDDFQLALFLLYELHYRGLPGVDDRMEWHPGLLAFRESLELPFELALRDRFDRPTTCEPIAQQLQDTINDDDAPSLSSFLSREGTAEMYREFLIHRSAYHLREADPHSFGIPRLRGKPKVALLEIQSDEYGGGDLTWMHSVLFAGTMAGLGLDSTEGAYIDRLPGVTLATMNLMSLFALHRRLRGALVGHLATFELTSCIPNRRYADGLRRLGFDRSVTTYFDEHVEADAAHGSIAANDLAGSLIQQDWTMEADVMWGASCLLGLEARWASQLLDAWRSGISSLYEPACLYEPASAEPDAQEH